MLALVDISVGRHPREQRDQDRIVVVGEVGRLAQRVHAARRPADPGEDSACGWHGGAPSVRWLSNRRSRDRCSPLLAYLAQAAAVTGLRRVVRARSASTATVAASRAAPAAIRPICQPGMPPITTVWTGTLYAGPTTCPDGSG